MSQAADMQSKHKDHLGFCLLKSTFLMGVVGLGYELLHFHQTPGDAAAAGVWTRLQPIAQHPNYYLVTCQASVGYFSARKPFVLLPVETENS